MYTEGLEVMMMMLKLPGLPPPSSSSSAAVAPAHTPSYASRSYTHTQRREGRSSGFDGGGPQMAVLLQV